MAGEGEGMTGVVSGVVDCRRIGETDAKHNKNSENGGKERRRDSRKPVRGSSGNGYPPGHGLRKPHLMHSPNRLKARPINAATSLPRNFPQAGRLIFDYNFATKATSIVDAAF